jgi:nitrous-oxide reductase
VDNLQAVKRPIILAVAVGLGALAIIGIQRYSAAERGERRFAELGCAGCHFSGGGPNLTNVVKKHDDALLERFILDPQAVYKERNMRSLNQGFMYMPKVVATPDDVHDIVAYLHEMNKQ